MVSLSRIDRYILIAFATSTLSAQVAPTGLAGAPANRLTPENTSSYSQPERKPLPPDQRGDIYMARKMFREAIDAYREAPESAVSANKIGIAYHQMQEMVLAKKQYERAIKLRQDYPEAINNLGTVYYAAKNYRRATSQYKRALRYAPQSASIMSNLGTAYFARKQYKQASEIYEKALAIDPEIFEHKGSAGVLLQERSVEERAKFHYYMAKMYAKTGQTDRALQYLRRSIEEGYAERKKITQESEFTALKDLPEFKELLAMEPRVL